jgi:hypothetical protein
MHPEFVQKHFGELRAAAIWAQMFRFVGLWDGFGHGDWGT